MMQERKDSQDAATRDYQEKVRQLDTAGTVEEANDRKAGGSAQERRPSGEEPHERRAGGTKLDPQEAKERGSVGCRRTV